MSKVDIKVPDIGDFSDVEIIEVLVSNGDTVAVEDSLITLETDKASMEVPASDAGTINLTVSVGDKVSEGDVIGTVDTDSAAASAGDSATASADASTSAASTSESPAADSGNAASGNAGTKAGERIDVAVPDIGDSAEVEVIEVLVSIGDDVEIEQSLITLESDKASMEVPSPAAGRVESISVAVGDKVDEGSALLVLLGGATAAPSAGASTKTASTPSPAPDKTAATPDSSPEAAADAGGSLAASGDSPTRHIPDSNIRNAHASPGVRRYARIHGADLSEVKGSGKKDRILKEDVIAFIKGAMEQRGKPAAGGGAVTGGSGIPPIPEVDFSKFGDTEQVEMGRINKLSARNLHRAWLNVPMVTHHDEADVTDMEAFRKSLKNTAREGDPKVTGLAFHMKAMVACLKAFPKFNSSITPDGESLIYKKYFNVGIAVDTPNGLVVPVFKDVDKKSINDLAVEMADMSKRARDKKLKPGEMQGASMTISSLGGIGGTAFTPLVNPPEVAILGITRASMKPVWDGKEFQPRLMCPLDLSYDHRVIDGADAARFMAHYCQIASDIRRLLL